MRRKALKYLACPECNSDLDLEGNISESNSHIMSGKLQCKACSKDFPIIKGVPFFCLDPNNKIVEKNKNNFADEWIYFTSVLDEKNEKLAKHELDSYFQPLINYDELDNKTVLDAGCGGGRFTYVTGRETNAKEIFGVDLSNAVLSAFKNTKDNEKITIIQADITKLPFKKKSIDFIYSVGVLHHLPDPKHGFSSLVKFLSEEGKILSWVYGKEGNSLYITFADPIRKLITSKLPFWLNLFLSFVISFIVWIIIWAIYFPLNIMLTRKIANKILPFNEYFGFFMERGFGDFWRTVIDKMIPTISYYISEKEFKDWFTSNNLNHKILFRNGHSWLGIGDIKGNKNQVKSKSNLAQNKV